MQSSSMHQSTVAQQHPNMIPAVGKRRPLVIRKNNFVLTTAKRDEQSSNDSSNVVRESSFAGGGPLSTSNTIGINRIMVDSLNVSA